jgi:hypothetical protein
MDGIRARFLALAAASSVATAACAGDGSDDDGSSDDRDAAALACPDTDAEGGDPFGLALGVRIDGTDYVEVQDGDEVPMVVGFQGFLMLQLEARATLPVDDVDSVCLMCTVEVSASDAFAGVVQTGPVQFRAVESDEFGGPFVVILGSAARDMDALDGAEVVLSHRCDGESLSGAVERSVQLAI